MTKEQAINKVVAHYQGKPTKLAQMLIDNLKDDETKLKAFLEIYGDIIYANTQG